MYIINIINAVAKFFITFLERSFVFPPHTPCDDSAFMSTLIIVV